MLTAYGKKFAYDSFIAALKKANDSYHHIPLMQLIKKEDQYPYRVLIGTILSARTQDKLTAMISKKLFLKAPNPLKLSQLSEEEIIDLIYPVGFYRRKAKNIRTIAFLLLERYHGMIPDKIEDLLQFPCVGRKTANLVLGTAFKIDTISVDTHVHRISNRLGILKTKIPEETEQDLRSIFPQEYWIILNPYLVSHGQFICKPISPICSQCKINQFCHRIGIGRSR
jgi:endonuclease-3